ncbi:MFS transporter [Rhodobacterales bacterium]|nr:MFS transporter [Rhodobacterales bacterium]
MLSALVLVVLDAAIANVALPSIHTDLNVSAAATVWVVTAYQLAIVMALLPSAALGESLGYRKVYLTGIVLFTASSLLCTIAPSLPWLIGARFVQGLGAAPIMALAIALLRHIFPRRVIGTVIGWYAMVVALSTAIGPIVGAAILSVASWPWLFAVNIPIGIIALSVGRTLPQPDGNGRSLDLPSVVLNALGFGALVIGADQVIEEPLTGALLLCVSAASFAALVLREWPRSAPLIPLDLLRMHPFRFSVMASVCCFAAQMASFVALPFMLQHGLGLSTFMTGVCMTPWPIMVAIMGPLAGRLSDRVQDALLCTVGGIVLAAGLALAAVSPRYGSPVPLVIFTMIAGLGFGFFQVPNNRNMLMSIPRERSGAAGGMQGSARLVGQTAGSLVMTLLFTLTSSSVAPRAGLAIGAVLALLGALASAMRITRGSTAEARTGTPE